MPDQAHDLRQLAVCRRRASPTRAGRPLLLAVAGGKGGVGSTTVGLNLAAAMSKAGRSTVFVDADARGSDAALLRGREERYSLADVLSGRRTWNEAMQTTPNGLRLVVGGRAWNNLNGTQAALAGNLLESVSDGSLDAELAVIDVGNTMRGSAIRICRHADAVLMITAPNAAAVMNTFSALQTLTAEIAGRVYLLVNMAPTAESAAAVHYRLAWTARRLLGLQLRSAGYLPTFGSSTRRANEKRFSLNIRTLSVDTIRELFVSELLLNWQRDAKFNGRRAAAIAEPLEMDF